MFIERISEVTEVFERERDFRAASEAISKDAGVADISGYTDYGRVWLEFLALIEDELHPRATVIVLGDARTNGRPPRDDVFAAITAKAGRTFWLNPEPRLYWNYGDSVIAAYEKHCTAFECWRTDQLEEFVKALTRPEVRPNQAAPPSTGCATASRNRFCSPAASVSRASASDIPVPSNRPSASQRDGSSDTA